MRISPIAHNFARANVNTPGFGKYETPEAESLGDEMLEKIVHPDIYVNTDKLPGAVRDTEMVTIRKGEEGALWCEVNRSYFEAQSKRWRDLDKRLEDSANHLYSDFINSVENPTDEREKKHPIKVVKEGLYGPIYDPHVLNRIAWEVFSNDPKNLFKNGVPPDDEDSHRYERQEPENYAATRGWW